MEEGFQKGCSPADGRMYADAGRLLGQRRSDQRRRRGNNSPNDSGCRTEAPTQEETTAEETEGTTASLEEQMDAYWNEELDGYLKNDAGYPHGKEGMGAVVRL